MAVCVVVIAVVGVGLPLAVSQLLPPNTSGPTSPVVPLLLIAFLGALAGSVAPSLRGWALTALWVVAGAALVLAAWTDLVLNVSPSIATVDAWRDAAFIAIVGAVLVVTAGFAAAAAVRRRGPAGRGPRVVAAAVVAVSAVCVAGAGLTAVGFSRTGIVLQDDLRRVTVVATEAGIEVTPATLTGVEYHVVYESTTGRSRTLAVVMPLRADDGAARAVTASEAEAWIAGDWAALGPPFVSAVTSITIAPGERRYGGSLRVVPSPDGTGGVLWYASEPGALRPWPPGSDEGPAAEPAPWPIDDHVVVPVAGD